MILEELRDELRDLGFEEDSTMTEYDDIFLHAVNRASWLIYDTVIMQLKSWYKKNYKKTTDVTEKVYYDGDAKMKSFHKVVTLGRDEILVDTYTVTVADDDEEIGEVLLRDVEPWTPKRPSVLTADSTDETEIGLPDNVLRPMALLTAHYLWLDDDETKAAYYYNEYEAFVTGLINALSTDASCTVMSKGWGW